MVRHGVSGAHGAKAAVGMTSHRMGGIREPKTIQHGIGGKIYGSPHDSGVRLGEPKPGRLVVIITSVDTSSLVV